MMRCIGISSQFYNQMLSICLRVILELSHSFQVIMLIITSSHWMEPKVSIGLVSSPCALIVQLPFKGKFRHFLYPEKNVSQWKLWLEVAEVASNLSSGKVEDVIHCYSEGLFKQLLSSIFNKAESDMVFWTSFWIGIPSSTQLVYVRTRCVSVESLNWQLSSCNLNWGSLVAHHRLESERLALHLFNTSVCWEAS